MKPLVNTEENIEKAIQAFNAALTHEKADTVILADVSGSMDERIPAVGQTRFAVMKNALLRVVSAMQKPAAVLMFATNTGRVTSWESIDATRFPLGGGTKLARALNAARKLNPSHIVVISDGEPHDASEVLAIASTMLCKIDVYYCGPGYSEPVNFCKTLAQFGGEAIIDPSCVTMLDSMKLLLTDAIAA